MFHIKPIYLHGFPLLDRSRNHAICFRSQLHSEAETIKKVNELIRMDERHSIISTTPTVHNAKFVSFEGREIPLTPHIQVENSWEKSETKGITNQ